MPWLETDPMDQRLQFILDDQRGLYDRTELCARYRISRKTGYKWLARYAAEGRRGLQAQSRAPHHSPHRIPEAVAQLSRITHSYAVGDHPVLRTGFVRLPGGITS